MASLFSWINLRLTIKLTKIILFASTILFLVSMIGLYEEQQSPLYYFFHTYERLHNKPGITLFGGTENPKLVIPESVLSSIPESERESMKKSIMESFQTMKEQVKKNDPLFVEAIAMTDVHEASVFSSIVSLVFLIGSGLVLFVRRKQK